MSTENRLLFFNQERLEKVRQENFQAYFNYQTAWNWLIGALITVAVSMLFVWALVQYELFQRAKKWLIPKEQPLKKLLKEASDTSRELGDRWYSLVYLIKVALGELEEKDMCHRTIEELIDAISTSTKLSLEEKERLIPILHRAEEVLYGMSQVTEEEWHSAFQTYLLWQSSTAAFI